MRVNKRESLQLIYQSSFGGTKVFIDNTNEKIVLRNRYLFFIRRERVIPFTAISRVVVDREVYAGGPYGGSEVKWKLSIVVGGAKVAIEDSKNEWEMWSLGQRMSQLTGKEMVDRSSGKGEARFDPNVSREEMVAKWQRKYKEDREQRTCQKCGAKNTKERTTCAKCGAPLASGQAEDQQAKEETIRDLIQKRRQSR